MSAHPFGRLPASGIRACRVCGCTDHDACVDPATGIACHWVEDDLCSSCVSDPAEEAAEKPLEPTTPARLAMAAAGTSIAILLVVLSMRPDLL